MRRFAAACVLGAVLASAARAVEVERLLEGMPANDSAAARAAFDRAIKGGKDAILALCGRLVPPGTGDDSKVRFLLSGLSFHVARSGAARERDLFERAVVEALWRAGDAEIKAFLIRLLQWSGGDEAARRVGELLEDPALCEPAAFTLRTIGGDAAEEALARALASARDETAPTVIKTLGELHSRRAAGAIAKLASSGKADVSAAALRALAQIGDPASRKVLAGRMKSGGTLKRAEAVENCLLFARRLAEGKRGADAIAVLREVLDGDFGSAARCAAMVDLASISPRHALADLLDGLESKSSDVRDVAAGQLGSIPGDLVTRRVLAKLESASPATRVTIIGILARRADAASLRACLDALDDRDASVRAVAIEACAAIGGAEAVDALVARLASADAAAASAAKEALVRMRGADVEKTMAGRLAAANAGGKAALIGILAARRTAASTKAVLELASHEAKEVRAAAFDALRVLARAGEVPALVDLALKGRDAADRAAAAKALTAVATRLDDPGECAEVVLAAMKGSDPAARAGAFGVLAVLGGEKALAAVLDAAKAGDAATREAAIRALADWPDISAGGPLVELASGGLPLAQKVLALRGAARLARESKSDDAARVALSERLLKAAPRADERKLAVSCLASIRSPAALDRVLALLDDAELGGEAAVAASRIATPYEGATAARPAHAAGLKKAAGMVQGDLKKGIEAAIDALSRPDAANLAKGRPVKTNRPHEGDRVPARAVDGDTARDAAWFANGSPAQLEIDLGTVERVETVEVFFYWDGSRYYQYKVDLSADGRAWKTVVDESGNTTPSNPQGVAHKFAPTDARYVRLDVSKNSANPSVHVAEVRVFAEGTGPKPAAKRERPKPDAEGFVPLFNGEDLAGWIGDTAGYVAEDGKIVCRPGGNLYTQDTYSDFVLRFEFKLTPGANNGLGIRTPPGGDAAYVGMELQILDDTAPQYRNLQPFQYHGSIYGIVPSKRGHQKPVGEWNVQEVTADGPKIKVVLNGTTIVDADLSKITQTDKMHDLKKHPGMRNESGHIGFLGHGSVVEFRNIRVKDLTGGIRKPPPGFTALFNGKDLAGWKGLVAGPYDNPHKRATLAPDDLAKRQAEADADMRAHWRAEDGILVFDGRGRSLCTAKDYADFEMYVDWKIKPRGDSGVYLRGYPQVQIWDTAQWPEGSGGLYNNQKNPRSPLVCADNPIGEWNTFRIKMIGERVTVHLNGQLVVDNVVLENYWDRSKPVLPSGQIELQNHGNTLYFRNIFMREIPPGGK